MDQVTLIEDSDGQLMLPFTENILNQMGWDIGDELLWEIKENDTVTITKKD